MKSNEFRVKMGRMLMDAMDDMANEEYGRASFTLGRMYQMCISKQCQCEENVCMADEGETKQDESVQEQVGRIEAVSVESEPSVTTETPAQVEYAEEPNKLYSMPAETSSQSVQNAVVTDVPQTDDKEYENLGEVPTETLVERLKELPPDMLALVEKYAKSISRRFRKLIRR